MSVTLGYVILYVRDVDASLTFYERAFGLTRRFLQDDGGKAYGELDTGAARVGFSSLPLVADLIGGEPLLGPLTGPPLGIEIALLTDDVQALYDQAVAAGATPVNPPAAKPWGQTVAYVRDMDGNLVELCTPIVDA